MAAKPKLSSSTRARWESDPRKLLAWLIDELGLPVGGEALRLRAKSEGWCKQTGILGNGDTKLGKHKLGGIKPKFGKTPKSKFENENPSLDDDEFSPDHEGIDQLSKQEHEPHATLTPKEERFVGEYLIDLNATAAYKRAYPDVTDGSARANSARMMAKDNIAAAIAVAKAERAKRTNITSDKALADVWALATADARELSQVKVDACRCCHGEGYQ